MSSYYDEEFRPWEIVDGRAVVADEAEWQKLVDLGKCTACKTFEDCEAYGGDCPKSPRPIVKVTTDIFEDVKGPIVDTNGKELFTCHDVCSFSSVFDSDCTCGVIKANRLKRHAEVLDVLTLSLIHISEPTRPY